MFQGFIRTKGMVKDLCVALLFWGKYRKLYGCWWCCYICLFPLHGSCIVIQYSLPFQRET